MLLSYSCEENKVLDPREYILLRTHSQVSISSPNLLQATARLHPHPASDKHPPLSPPELSLPRWLFLANNTSISQFLPTFNQKPKNCPQFFWFTHLAIQSFSPSQCDPETSLGHVSPDSVLPPQPTPHLTPTHLPTSTLGPLPSTVCTAAIAPEHLPPTGQEENPMTHAKLLLSHSNHQFTSTSGSVLVA